MNTKYVLIESEWTDFTIDEKDWNSANVCENFQSSSILEKTEANLNWWNSENELLGHH